MTVPDEGPSEPGVSRRRMIKATAAGGAVAWTAPAVFTRAQAFASATAQPCDGGLNNGGVFTLPAGATAQFSNVLFDACNPLTWGYELDGVEFDQGSKIAGCDPVLAADATIAPATGSRQLRVYMRDDRCGVTYFSDETPVDHATVTGTNPWNIQIADAGGECEARFSDREAPNLELTLTIVCD